MREKSAAPPFRRIIIIDDSESIHRDYESILGESERSESEKAVRDLSGIMFDEEPNQVESGANDLRFEIDHAYQGKEGYEKIVEARAAGVPYQVAFVDMRMPPGWDGLETIEKIWDKDPDLQIVICSAYADYTWNQIIEKLGHSNRLLILKKPFDQAEVYQLATALSEKWLSERSARDLLASLEQKVEEQTREVRAANAKLVVLNRELEAAVDEAQCAVRAKGRFLATMSHEIRSSLNGIMGAAQMLNKADLRERELEFASIIQSSGDALMAVINDILDYSKYENGQLALESIPFSLRELMGECAASLKAVADKFGVALELRWDESIPETLLGDPPRIRQILLNLLNNAFKFGKNGRVVFGAVLEEFGPNQATVRVDVVDEGIGMKTATVEHLFSAFMQADSSTTREFGGAGLGLAICKLLSEAMEARIEVKSDWGEGSAFALHLPLALPSVAVGDAGVHPSAVAPSPQYYWEELDLSGKRVLFVDDNVVNGKLGRHFLDFFNIETDLALNGLEAVERFSSASYDAIFMDLQMPAMNGLEATRQIRFIEVESCFAQRVPIIALTANVFRENREDCLLTGMDDFLPKPLRLDELSSVLRRWLLDPVEEEARQV